MHTQHEQDTATAPFVSARAVPPCWPTQAYPLIVLLLGRVIQPATRHQTTVRGGFVTIVEPKLHTAKRTTLPVWISM